MMRLMSHQMYGSMKTGRFNDYILKFCNVSTHIDAWREECILTFPQKDDIRVSSNITLTFIVAKIYNKLIAKPNSTENLKRSK